MFGKQSSTGGNHWNIVRGIHCKKISLLNSTTPKILTKRYIWTFKSDNIFFLKKQKKWKLFNLILKSISYLNSLTPPE